MPAVQNSASVEVSGTSANRVIRVRGRLDTTGVALIWNEAVDLLEKSPCRQADLSEVEFCDGAGIALLLELRRKGVEELLNPSEQTKALLAPFDEVKLPEELEKPVRKEGVVIQAGRAGVQFLNDTRDLIAFTGRLLVLLVEVCRRPSMIRWPDVWLTFEKVGNNALLIVVMIGFLMGLIMGFQSAMPLRQFGVDIFVVNLVALAILRELGPIMTAIVLAGRSGSAFAAEIGTMKVNEEVDALTTMGLDPGRFLVVPRVLAALMATPVLTIFANAAGILGGLLVVLSLGHPWSSIMNQLTTSVDLGDVFSGLIKAVVFGLLVAAVGCLRGLQTKNGALAVGESTTRAVVSAIFLIVLTDAVFAVAFYVLDF